MRAGGIVSCAITLAIATAAQAKANRYETSTLFRKGAWVVELTYDTLDQDYWCSAETRNRRAQVFSLTLYDTEQFTVFIFDNNWDIAPRSLKFLIDIDYSRWTMDGQGEGSSISVTPDDGTKAAKFTRQLMQGNAVALLNTEEQRLATFSLNGSYAAVSSLFECYKRIAKSDPFSGTDPFLGAEDPF